MDFQISRHAHDEMARRQITRKQLDLVLRRPEQRIPQSPGKEILQSRIQDGNGKLYLLRAILAIEKEPAVVVTVYRTSKVEKYWRPE